MTVQDMEAQMELEAARAALEALEEQKLNAEQRYRDSRFRVDSIKSDQSADGDQSPQKPLTMPGANDSSFAAIAPL
jgi:ribonuclease HI